MRFMFQSSMNTMRPALAAVLGVSIFLFSGALSSAQAPMRGMEQPAGQNKQLAEQVADLRAQVAKLQAAVQQSGSGNKSNANSGMAMGTTKPKAMGGMGMGMGMMGDKGEMGGMSGKAAMPPGGMGMGMMDDKGEMGGMSGGQMGGPSAAPAAAMGMCCMGEMGGMSGGTASASGGMSGMSGSAPQPKGGMAAMNGPSSAMPGQPGSSHLYHVGSTGFFLNHSQHITLSGDQKLNLNRLKERAMLDRAYEQRRIDQAEQELYTLTGADQLDNSKVQAKVGEIERIRSEQRMNFIRAVGQATNVLTHEQHQALMGMPTGTK